MNKNHKIWLSNYLENCRTLNRSDETIKNYSADLRKFIVWFEASFKGNISTANGKTISTYKHFLADGKNPKIEKRPEKTLTKIFNILFKKAEIEPIDYTANPLGVSSRRRHLSSVKNFFEYLKQINEDSSNLFAKNPVKSKLHAIKLKEIDVKPTEFITDDEWNRIEEKVYRIKDRLIINLLYWCGIRLNELADLKILDFCVETQTITFNRKGGFRHTLAPQKANMIFYIFKSYLGTRYDDSPYLFPSKKAGRMSNKALYNLIITIFRKAECRDSLSPHSYRKTCATKLYIKTKNLLLVREYLNHNDAKVTQTYIDKTALNLHN